MPERRIATDEDLALFHNGSTYKEVLDYVLELNKAAIGHEIGISEDPSKPVQQLLAILKKVSELVDANPAGEASSRFGKEQFRDFYDAVVQDTPKWFMDMGLDGDNAMEVGGYFCEAFGNRKRIDYGSGHELNFICVLLCLRKLGLLSESDDRDLVCGVFNEYLKVMRKIQKEYWLEPAGSHGVWGLDDYHFLPFLFGSGQLSTHKYLRPISIHDQDIVDMFADRYYYFGCIKFINQVKTVASLRWHSPMLDDISGVKKWAKVNEGMIKMYKAEVLGKLPIMQHFMFSKLLPADPAMTPASKFGEVGHFHCWADCCGIKVPSAIAASASTAHTTPPKAGLPFD